MLDIKLPKKILNHREQLKFHYFLEFSKVTTLANQVKFILKPLGDANL